MHVFWDLVIRPALEAAGARRVLEIGAGAAAHSRRLVEYCEAAGGHLHVVDPKPLYDPHAFARQHGAHFTSHTVTSLETFPHLPAVDAALIDGDHNWYTVYHELRALDRGDSFPLVLLHDVAWPFGRRDLYYAPERIPSQFRHPHSRLGVERGNDGVAPEGGFGVGLEKAAHEGGPRNGVLTAVEDFRRENGRALRFELLPALWGLGVLANEELLDRRPELRALLDSFSSPEFQARLLDLAERVRGEEWVTNHAAYESTAAQVAPLQQVLIKHGLENARLRQSLWGAAPAAAHASRPRLSVVVVVFDMQRAAPRTLRSLAVPYQREIEAGDYEVLVVENGSRAPLDREMVCGCGPNFRYLRIEPADASPSPAAAVNRGLAEARGDLIGVMVDGARIVTPRLLSLALRAAVTAPRAVVATSGWTLGHEPQNTAAARGYSEAEEDALLDGIRWPEEPYRLFEIAMLDGSSSLFGPIAESNALFLSRAMWEAVGGLDERFDQMGGGFVNLDLLDRCLQVPGSEMVLMLGEGTFHQTHGGISTNSLPSQLASDLEQWNRHYHNLRGHDWRQPRQRPRLYGEIPEPLRAHLVSWGVNEGLGRLASLAAALRDQERGAADAKVEPVTPAPESRQFLSRLARRLRRPSSAAPRNT